MSKRKKEKEKKKKKKAKSIPGVGFEPTRTIRPLELKSNALTTRPSWCHVRNSVTFIYLLHRPKTFRFQSSNSAAHPQNRERATSLSRLGREDGCAQEGENRDSDSSWKTHRTEFIFLKPLKLLRPIQLDDLESRVQIQKFARTELNLTNITWVDSVTNCHKLVS